MTTTGTRLCNMQLGEGRPVPSVRSWHGVPRLLPEINTRTVLGTMQPSRG